MTSARDQLVGILVETFYDHLDPAAVRTPEDRAMCEDMADRLLAAKQEQTCKTCGGTGKVTGWTTTPFECPDCTDGVVPGTEPLVILGPERVPSGLWDERLSDFVAVYRRAGSPDE